MKKHIIDNFTGGWKLNKGEVMGKNLPLNRTDMMLLVAFGLSYYNSQPINDDFVKIVTDDTWDKTIKRAKDGFLFFHSPNQRVSDMGYLRFVEIARKYAEKANFFVIPAAKADSTARLFRIPGYPSLYHIQSGTKVTEMLGAFSFDTIERFISNFTLNSFIDITIGAEATKEQMLSEAILDKYDRNPCIFMFCDNTTRFGRSALTFTLQNFHNFRFVCFSKPENAEAFGVRYPSLVLRRGTDEKEFIMSGEPTPSAMNEWINSIPPESYSELQTKDFFNEDGTTTRNVISFLKRDEKKDKVFQNINPNRKYFYADPDEYRALRNLIGIESDFICICANYSFIGANDCSNEEVFDSSVFVPTPPELYQGIAHISEYSFNDLIINGPLFTVFALQGDSKSQDVVESVESAVSAVFNSGSKTRWAIWDVHKKIPSFREQLDLKVPSIWFFPSENLNESVEMTEKKDIINILEWASKQDPTNINTNKIMESISYD